MKPVDASVAFLKRWHPLGPWVLTCIDADEGYIQTRGFGAGDEDGLREFISLWRRRRNLYFGANVDAREPTRIESKSRKQHIGKVIALHADIDHYKGGEGSEAALIRLTEDLPRGIPGPPSVINSSGNGLQAFWLLREPVDLASDPRAVGAVETRNRSLAVRFGGDMTFDVNRIMRLPWSINWPNQKKREMGLKPALARQITMNMDLRYDLDAFPPHAGDGAPMAMPGERLSIGTPVTIDDIDDLRVPDRTKAIIALGAYEDEKRTSRSEWLWSAILSMIRGGESDETILGVITDDRFRISDCVLDKPDPEQHARRQIARAHAWLSKQREYEFDE